MTLKVKGVTYDVGMPVIKGGLTREALPLDLVTREMQIISKELHCTAVRITGQDVGRLKMAADAAARQGLDVWLSPSLHDAGEQETFGQIIEAACVCEELRKHDIQIVLCVPGLETQHLGHRFSGNPRKRFTRLPTIMGVDDDPLCVNRGHYFKNYPSHLHLHTKSGCFQCSD